MGSTKAASRHPVIRRGAALAAAVVALGMSVLAGVVAGEIPIPPGFGLAGYDGYLTNRAEAVNTPARVSRVAVVPGSSGNEVWGFGHARTYGQDAAGAQVVFLNKLADDGWKIAGPPKDAQGTIQNPTLTALAMAATGEGWAVGKGGVTVHRAGPGQPWVYEPLCQAVTCSDLYAITLSHAGDHGFAVGRDGTVIRLAGGQWHVDDRPVSQPTGGAEPSLVGVALAEGDVAWAIASRASAPGSNGLELYRRDAAAWVPVATGKAYLDSAGPVVVGGSQVRFSVAGMSVASSPDGKTIWFGGSMAPVDAANPSGDGSTANSSERPFLLQLTGGAWTGYCPAVYTLSGDQASEAAVCDRPLPMSTFGVQSISVVAGGEVFAGGFGLYHYRPSGDIWFREPDPIGMIGSVSFASATEGWFASATIVGGVLPEAATMAVGHYTAKPKPARDVLARWPIPSTGAVYGATISASNAGPPLAVGESGLALARTALGWERVFDVAPSTLFSVAYAGTSDTAWAVGESGRVASIVNGSPGTTRAIVTRPGRGDHLYGVAFSSAGVGWAVGGGGSLVFSNGDSWQYDKDSGGLTTSALYAVDAVPGAGFVAVGEGGTILWNQSGIPGGWKLFDATANPLAAADTKPALYAVDVLPDGSFVAGGAASALVVGAPNRTGLESVKVANQPHEGTMLAVQGRRENGTLRLVASIAPSSATKFLNGRSLATQGWLMTFDGDRWHDEHHSNTKKLAGALDVAMTRDPILTIVPEPGGRAGWAVGGRPAGVKTEDNEAAISTGSVYRFDFAGNPRPPLTEAQLAPTAPPAGGFNFAFFSDTSCGSTLCSLSIGTGTTADEVALKIRDDINEMVEKKRKGEGEPGAPEFVLFGGSARGAGSREEMAAFAAYVAGFKVPVYGAVGARDLTLPPAANRTEMPGLVYNLGYPVDAESQTRTTGSNRFWAEELKHMPQPWGSNGELPKGFDDVPFAVAPAANRARTHYAVDYKPGGRTLGRFVFLDTSTRSLATTGQNPSEAQSAFLSSAVVNAGVPTFVVMNTPTRDPMSLGNTALFPGAESNTLEQTLFGAGVTAVFAGGVRTNAVYTAPEGISGAVPFYVAGSGGAPMTGSKWPTDGHYHSWLHVTAGAAAVDGVSTRAPLTVRPIPVLDTVALTAPTLVASGGSTLKFDGIARAIDGGGPSGDEAAAFRTFLNFPVLGRCEGFGERGTGPSSCFNRRALIPDFRFVSEDPSIADFVRPQDNSRTQPLLFNGRVIPDSKSGFLCTYKTGQVWVRIEAGGRQARLPVTVVPGKGRCVDDPVVEIPEPPADDAPILGPDPIPNTPAAKKPAKVIAPAPPAKPAPPAPPPPAPIVEPAPPVKPVPKVFVPPQPLAEISAVVVPPAPSLIPSPAPPASASAAGAEKQDEKEVEHESAGQEGGDFTAIRHQRSAEFDAATGLMLATAAALFGVFGAAIAAAVKAGSKPAIARVVYPRDLR